DVPAGGVLPEDLPALGGRAGGAEALDEVALPVPDRPPVAGEELPGVQEAEQLDVVEAVGLGQPLLEGLLVLAAPARVAPPVGPEPLHDERPEHHAVAAGQRRGPDGGEGGGGGGGPPPAGGGRGGGPPARGG